MKWYSTLWFPLAMLALLAGLSMWVERAVKSPPHLDDGSSRHDPDYIVNNFHILRTNANGDPHHALAAAEMKHFPDDDSTELSRPRFTQYSTRKPYTQIEAQRGLVSADGENVYFMDNVKVVRGASKQKGELTVLTEYLHILPDLEVAKTDRPVSILQAPNTVLKGNGMEYNKKLGTLKLAGNVRVHYVKPDSRAAALKSPPALKPGKTAAGKSAAAPAKKASGTRQATNSPPAKKKTATKSNKTTTNKSATQPGKKTRIRRTYEHATQP